MECRKCNSGYYRAKLKRTIILPIINFCSNWCRKILSLGYPAKNSFNFSKSAVAVNDVSKKCTESEKEKLPPKPTGTPDYYKTWLS